MGVKRRIGIVLATAVFVVACLMVTLFSGVADSSAGEPAYAATYSRTNRLASSSDIIQCVSPTATNDFVSNTSGYYNGYVKIPNGTSFCSYTGAYFGCNEDGTDSIAYNHFFYNSQDNEISFRTSASNVRYSNVFMSNLENGKNVYSYCSVDADSKCLYFDSYPASNSGTCLATTFNLSQNMVNALADRLLVVKITPYIVFERRTLSQNLSVQMSDDISPDYVDLDCFCYNKGEVQHGSPSTATVYPLGAGDTASMVLGNTLTLSSGVYTTSSSDNCSFMEVSLSNFFADGAINMIIAEIGIKVTVTPNTGLIFHNSSTYTITGEDRNEGETIDMDGLNYAKPGDTINFNMKIRSGSVDVYLEADEVAAVNAAAVAAGKSPDATQSGIVFHQLFNSSPLTVEYYLKDEDSGDMEVDQGASSTGQAASIIVKSGSLAEDKLIIEVAIRYKNLKTNGFVYMANKEFEIYVDRKTPSAPTLEANSFYMTYLYESGMLSFYTSGGDAEQGYLDLNEAESDADKVQFTEDSLDIERKQHGNGYTKERKSGGSDLTVYYRATYYGEGYPVSQGEKSSDGVTVNVNDPALRNQGYIHTAPTAQNINGSYVGICCVSASDFDDGIQYVETVYSSLRLDLSYYDTSSNSIAYRKKGVWALEFFAYDNVGNYNYSPIKSFIKVDITEYKFVVNYYVGDPNNPIDIMGSDTIRLFYEKVTSSGKLSDNGIFSIHQIVSDGSSDGVMYLNRGDRICIQIRYSSKADYNRYILTGFQVGGGAKQPCTDFVYRDYKTILAFTDADIKTVSGDTTKSVEYTFDVSDALCKDVYKNGQLQDNRVINLYFKYRINITATALNQAYSGVSKKIIPYATFDSERLSSLNIKTTYYTALATDGSDYLYDQDIASGVYRMKNTTGALNSSSSDEQFVVATGTYQPGMIYYRKVDNNGSNLPLHTGQYYCACEVTNNINYYGMAVIIFTVSPGTPDLSTLYGLEGNGKNQRIEIQYGESLSMLDWDPAQVDGYQKFNTNFYVFYEDNTAYGLSSKGESEGTEVRNGILGYYKIGVDDETVNAFYKASQEYRKPSAGLHSIKVTFVPIVGEYRISGYEIEYYPQYENGNFVRNYDYNTRTVSVSVYVRPSKAVAYALNRSEMACDLIESTDEYERVVYTYTGGALGIKYTVLSTYEDVNGNLLELGLADPLNLTDTSGSSRKMTEIMYAAIPDMSAPTDDLVFTGDEPVKAGLYAAKVTVIEANCNYTGQKIWYILINKVGLTVSVGATSCDYQYETLPAVTVTTGSNREIDVELSYSFYSYDPLGGLTYEEACIDNYLIPAEKLRPYVHTPVDAGTYVVKVSVVDNDYAGENYALYTIYQVTDANGYATKAWPGLNESTLASGCHICYGQPLMEARVATGTGYYVRYNYQNYLSSTRKTTSSNLVAGTFFVASEKYEDWLRRNSKVRSSASREEYILAMRNYTADTNFDGYSGWYMCFAANDSVNFDFLYKQITVRVGYASLNWSRVILDPIYYETVVSYDYLSTAGNTVNIAKKVAYVYSQNGNYPTGKNSDEYYAIGSNVYVYVDTDRYNLTLDSQFFQRYEVGSHYLRFGFMPTESNVNNFKAESYDCSLTVRKKTLGVSLGSASATASVEKSENVLTSYYNYYLPIDAYRFFTYSGNTVALPSFTGVFIYSKGGKTYVYNNVSGQYVVTSSKTATANDVRSVWTVQQPITDGSGNPLYDDLGLPRTEIVRKEILNENVGSAFTVVEYAPVLPAGLYSVRYVINNANYIGSLDYAFDLKKAPLQVSTAPQIVDEDRTLCYNMRISDLRFYGGAIVAKKSGEAVNGRYSVDPSQSSLRFGNYNTVLNVLYVFTPDDTDNYEVYYGSLDNKRVNKADVSEQMDLEIGTYVYAQGHRSGSTDYMALTRDFLKNSYSAAGKDSSVDTYEKFVKAFLDYTCVVPGYLGDNYRIEILGSADGRFVGAGSYEARLVINDTEIVYSDTPTGALGEAYDSGLNKYYHVEELNYCGVVTVVLTVNKDSAYIVLSDDRQEGETDYDYIVKKTFDSAGGSRSVSPVLYDSLGNEITSVAVLQSYYHNGVAIQTPSAIGRYDVRMSLNNTRNYNLVGATYRNGDWVLGASVSYVIAGLVIGINKDDVSFNNLTQTYTEAKTVTVSFGINNAVCTLEYVRLTDGGEETGARFIERFPTEAGRYNVHMMFSAEDNNGYEDDVVWDQPLVINKYTAKITCSDVVYAYYTGRPYEVMTPFTEPYGLSLRYSYATYLSDEYTSLARTSDLGALHAGKYSVLLEIVDANYRGTKTITFEMIKASLTVTEEPEFGSYVYHSDLVPEAAAGKGKVYCTENGVEVAGTFTLDYDDISVIGVGRQTVTYTFTPSPDGEGYVDYDVVTGKVKLTVEKATYDMEYVSLYMDGKAGLLVTDDYTVGYNGDRHEFSARFDTSRIYEYGTLNSDFHVNIVHYYNNGGIATPYAIGTYTVTANVVSENYTGTKTWERQLIIIKGVPVIAESPTVTKTIKADDSSPLVSSDFIGGRAVVNGKPNVTIDGVFSVADSYFSKANLNEVEVTFTPYDTDLYDSVVFSVFVNVVGKDVFSMTKASDENTFDELPKGETISGVDSDWTSSVISIPGYACSRLIRPDFSYIGNVDVASHTHGVYIAISPANGAEYLTYGVSLRSFSLEFKPCVNNCPDCMAMYHDLVDNGVLEFEDESIVPSVGDSVAVRYSLYYNANVQDWEKLNEMTGNINLGSILRKVRFGSTALTELIGFYDKSLTEEYRFNIRYGGKNIDAEPSEIAFSYNNVLTAQDNGTTVYLTTFVSRNYEFASLPLALTLKVYTGLANTDIGVGKTSKVYDGNALSAKDLELTVDNTVMPIPDSSYSITVLDANGKICDGIDIGTYTVLIFLKDDEYRYYGESETTFTIEKRDVSEEIRLSKTGDTYASETFTIAPDIIYNGELLLSSEVTVKYRLAGTSGAFVGTISDAGLYELRVTVDSENYFAEKIFSYRISPKTLSVTLYRTPYVFVYGNEYAENRGISMEFSNGEDMEKVIYFQKEGYSRTTTPPTDAGTYVATIVLVSPNYVLSNGTFEYVIRPKSVTIEVQPTIQVQTDANGNEYNIKYGSKLSSLNTKFLGGRAIAGGDVVPGKFMVNPDEADVVLNAGTSVVTVLFVPDSSNCATVSFTMSVTVSKVEVVMEFTNLTASYTGFGVKDALTYVISGVSENLILDIKFVSVVDGAKTTNPVNAGSYELEVTCANENYSVRTTTVYGGSSAPVFVVNKAAVDESRVIHPVAVPVAVGESLMKSSLNDGLIYYYNFANAVRGTFEFIQTAKSFKTAGTETVEYRFIPTDSNNFDSYRGTVSVTVNKGMAVIHWNDVTVTYGTPADFSSLSTMFTTSPSNLTYRVSTFDIRNNVLYDDSGVDPLYMNANTYTFTCWVEDDNYVSEVYRFDYIVEKKKIDIDFINEKGDVVTAYNVLYAKESYYGFKLYDSNDTTGKSYYLARDAATIYTNVQYTFASRDEGVVYDARTAPTALGSYTITVTLIHDNYVASATATYKIAKGTVEEINFDIASLSGQVYGAVSRPIIVTVPTDVKYYIIYQGYDRVMPTDVGSYNITVYIDDESYNSKQVSAVFKINPKPLTVSSYTAEDKVYDGTSTIALTGKLSGVLYGDEVTLTLRGATADGSAEPGKHGVTVTDYKLSGLKAENYTLTMTECSEIINIKVATVRAANSSSYMTSTSGFEEGTGITFYEVDTEKNQTGVVSKAVGASSTIIGYTVTVNGESAITSGQYKICVEIPEEYRNSDFTVDFSHDVLDPHREGDMYVFNTSISSGQIIFSKASFKFTYVILIVVAVIVVIAVVLVLVLNPMKKR